MAGFLDVIKFEGDNNTLVYKSEVEDFNTKSVLIVNESQEAIFYKDGQALDLFGSGRHTLETNNLPLLRKAFHLVYKEDTPFPCQVFFINKVSVLDIMWGTDSPITVEDSKYHLIIDVRSNGSMGFKVNNSRKFVVNVVGQLPSFSVEDIKRTIKGMLLGTIKNVLGKAIITSGISILEINAHLKELNDTIKEELNVEMASIGLEATHFYINSISAQPEDLAKLREMKEHVLTQMTEIDIEAVKEVKLGQAKAQSRAAQGFTYQEERQFDVLEGAAKNQNNIGSSIMGAGIGLGMGAGLGAGIGSAAVNTGKAMTSSGPSEPAKSGTKCSNCGTDVPANAKFCPNCGAKMAIKKFCTNCGTELGPDAKFCPNCGNKVE